MQNEMTAEEIKADMVARSKEFAATGPQVFANQDADFANELAMLEGRTKTNIIKVPIGAGMSLAIWGSLSADAMKRYLTLSDNLRTVGMRVASRAQKKTIKKTKDGVEEDISDAQLMDDITYDIYELISANPMITANFLKNNPDKFSPNDLGKMIEGFQVAMAEHAEDSIKREAVTKSFRGE